MAFMGYAAVLLPKEGNFVTKAVHCMHRSAQVVGQTHYSITDDYFFRNPERKGHQGVKPKGQ